MICLIQLSQDFFKMFDENEPSSSSTTIDISSVADTGHSNAMVASDVEQGLTSNALENGVSSSEFEANSTEYNAVVFLQKACTSDNVSERQSAVRQILKTLQAVENDKIATMEVLCLVQSELARDADPVVRIELLEQIPLLILHCSQSARLRNYKRSFFLPLLLEFLNNDHAQVRKTSYTAVSILIEQDLLTPEDIEHNLLPVLLRLSVKGSNKDDIRIESVGLLCKLVSVLGRDKVIQLFLNRFTELCDDPLFHIRKTCATHLGEICKVLGPELTEKVLVLYLISLSQDAVWGVRKACAECFPDVSNLCCMQTRRRELAPVFIVLLADTSRWVQGAAFQALGQFISTFADINRTGLQWVDGELKYDESQIMQLQSSSLRKVPDRTTNNHEQSLDASVCDVNSCSVGENCSEKEDLLNLTTDSSSRLSNDVQNLNENIGSKGLSYTDDTSNLLTKKTSEFELNVICDNNSDDEEESADDENFLRRKSARPRNPVPSSSILLSTSDKVLQCSPPCNADGFTVEDVESSGVTSLSPPQFDIGGRNVNAEEDRVQTEIELSGTSPTSSSFASFKFWQPKLPPPDTLNLAPQTLSEPDHESKSVEVESIPKENHATSSVVQNFMERRMRFGTVNGITSPTDTVICQSSQKHTMLDQFAACSLGVADKDEVSEKRVQDNVRKEQEEMYEDLPTIDDIVSAYDLASETYSYTISFHPNDFNEANSKPSSTTKNSSLIVPVFHEELNSRMDANETFMKRKELEYQDIIPQALLDQFLSMVEPSRAQAVENEISRHCAFNFPAVAFTIGRKHWPMIKPTYLALANDMQWKVRRTLAFSIHNLAAILGPEITAKDLLPVFIGFLRDLDEVRIGVLKNLYEFLKLLEKDVRTGLLSHLADFLQTENYRNWRFRHLFAEQLILLCDLFDAGDVNEYLSPIAMTLAIDKVAEIRHITCKLMAKILGLFHRFELSMTPMLTIWLLQDIIRSFAKSQRWIRRQTFVHVCEEIVRTRSLPAVTFYDELMPTLVYLSQDRIPNVRIALANLLYYCCFESSPDYFQSELQLQNDAMHELCKLLSDDTDRDVRLSASQHRRTELAPPASFSWNEEVNNGGQSETGRVTRIVNCYDDTQTMPSGDEGRHSSYDLDFPPLSSVGSSRVIGKSSVTSNNNNDEQDEY
uniref:Serine/threonine-protein phosphatase 4 regulatory subunit 1 n=1 Tax=Romanomermis culicivorax TaxID=13658 RepID=A0A915LDY7_ROMCU